MQLQRHVLRMDSTTIAPAAARPNGAAPDPLLALRAAILELVRDVDQRDPSLRQLAVLLTTLTSVEPQTVRGLAAHLNVAKPAITRAADAMEQNRLTRRVPDPRDRRSIIIQATAEGGQIAGRIAAAYSVGLKEAAIAAGVREG